MYQLRPPRLDDRCSTWPLTGATVGVPDAAIMSTPWWYRPSPREAPHVSVNDTGPFTGHTMPPPELGVLGAGAGADPAPPLEASSAAAAASARRRSSSRRWASASASSAAAYSLSFRISSSSPLSSLRRASSCFPQGGASGPP